MALQQNASALTLSHEQLKKCFLALCQHSVHSYEREIAQGFFTISGGHRVGVCGTAVVDEEGRIRQIKEPTSLCIRIARVEAQTKDPQLEELMRHAEEGILIAGAPGSGKTTMLRSCSRILSQQGKRIAVVDERRELWPVSEWGFSSAPPQNCDLLSGYPKAEGILHALRSLSPQLMLCDEVGGEKDAQAVAAGANAGVGMVVTVHARDTPPSWSEGPRRGSCLKPELSQGRFFSVAPLRRDGFGRSHMWTAFLRMCGAGMVVGCGWFAGNTRAAEFRQRRMLFEDLVTLCDLLIRNLEGRRVSLPVFFQKDLTPSLFSLLRFEGAKSEKFEKWHRNFWKDTGQYAPLSKEEMARIEEFWSELGSAGGEEEAGRLHFFSQYLQRPQSGQRRRKSRIRVFAAALGFVRAG